MNAPIKIGFRCDAGPDVGLGHLVRSIALARELRDRGVLCWFNGNGLTCRLAVRAGFTVVDSANGLPTMNADAWVVDLQRGCPPHLAQYLRDLCGTLVVLNGVGWDSEDPARLLADLVFYQGCSERPRNLDWGDWEGEWYEGAGWVILRPEFARLRRHRRGAHDPPRVLVSGGGAGKGGVADFVVGKLAGQGCDIRVVVGPADPKFRRAWVLRDNVEVYENPPDVAQIMAWADVAVVSYGMTAFECLCLGIPVVALCLTPEQAEGAMLVESRTDRALTHLGDIDAIEAIGLPWRGDCSRRALDFVDGLGVERVADKIMEKVEGRRIDDG